MIAATKTAQKKYLASVSCPVAPATAATAILIIVVTGTTVAGNPQRSKYHCFQITHHRCRLAVPAGRTDGIDAALGTGGRVGHVLPRVRAT